MSEATGKTIVACIATLLVAGVAQHFIVGDTVHRAFRDGFYQGANYEHEYGGGEKFGREMQAKAGDQ